ncbi:TPA: hypothetical protein ACIFCT_003165 [Acinetobacter baumannii]|uniref:hypothetical protein n=1 Tax=Acinetobacter calcoaceticus/baumannii complex TaxID=909768 RepID=UPI000347CEF2|nr:MULTISPECIES: hypothetical protein [Acinetobacter calcoaceticus/baumannii complex]MBZ0355352.1 hypothetical protein [Acinetobacter baumannii]MDQ9038440.1 hypothetical protein [Acinetobacter seifertii]MDR5636916.1 hypothetical protein [Acinetobacter baumannii]MDR8256485.1 hypothetical protein [Acinetobacter baumannii]MDT1826799.1 hypothetical protein [Acinetobacter baumannii]
MNNLFFVCSYINKSGEPDESVWCYLESHEGGYICSLTNKTIEQLESDVKSSMTKYSLDGIVTTKIVSEEDYYKNKYKVNVPIEISKDRFWELLECLPPEKWINNSEYEIFRVMECLAANLYTFCVFHKEKNKYFEVVADRHIDYQKLFLMC